VDRKRVLEIALTMLVAIILLVAAEGTCIGSEIPSSAI
jgi:hypothetical protein